MRHPRDSIGERGQIPATAAGKGGLLGERFVVQGSIAESHAQFCGVRPALELWRQHCCGLSLTQGVQTGALGLALMFLSELYGDLMCH
jgi:hypothetical protein